MANTVEVVDVVVDEDAARKAEGTLLEVAKRRFKDAVEAESAQRKREEEDLRFQVPEYQWTDEARSERSGKTVGNLTVPPRPTLSISLLQQPQQLVKNQAAAADLGVSIHPVSEDADEDLADIKQGLYRRIERDSNAEVVRLFALDRAIQCGRGWYRVLTQYDDDGDNEFDQEIVIKRILRQESVYIDPAAQEPDFSDANWAFLVAWVPLDTFCRMHPGIYEEGTDGEAFKDLAAGEPDWVKQDGDKKAVLVAEYWEKKHDEQVVCFLEDGSIVPETELGKRKFKAKRTRDRVSLHWHKITGSRVLESAVYEEWKLIPLVPVIGRELQPFDGERRFEGMVRPARDGQRLYNFAASSLVERMATEIKTPFIGGAGQFSGFESQWQQANTRTFPYIEYNVVTSDGKPLPPPQRAQLDSTGMSLAMMALQEGKGFVQSSTAVYDPSLGETPKRGQSGRSIIAQQQQADAGTSNYLQSLANISMPYEARVVMERMPTVYDRPGRVTRVLGGEDEKEKTVMLNAPFIEGPGGKPMPAPLDPLTRQPVKTAKTHDLRKGKYSISVSIGKSYQTRLQQGQEEFGQLLENLPPELQVLLLPTYMKFRDTPGAKEASELLIKYRDSKFQGLTDTKEGQQTPEQLQAQLAAMGQNMQTMKAQFDAAVQALQTKQAEQQAKILVAEKEAETKLLLAQMDKAAQDRENALKLELERLKAEKEMALERFKAQQEAQLKHEEMAHEVAMADAAGRTFTAKREGGQEQDTEEGRETSQGASRVPRREGE